MPLLPEQQARERIDAQLVAAGWAVQSRDEVNLHAAKGVAVREFHLLPGHGIADYLLFVNGKAVGVIEAKKEGETLAGVEIQTEQYSVGLPPKYPAPIRPLPFLFQSTGVETWFTNRLDPDPRARRVFHLLRPESFAAWLEADPLPGDSLPGVLRRRLRAMPTLEATPNWNHALLRDVQQRAVVSLEASLREDRPRALVQMATGSGKTRWAITAAYRLLKYGGAKRILFLVDRGNLGRQALKEFQAYQTPDDGRLFTELFVVQHLTSPKLNPAAAVVIGTIQRLYSVLQGKDLSSEDADEASAFEAAQVFREPPPVAYNPGLPIEAFDAIVIDECHRSIYTLWRQVLEYFDGYLIGLTATPAKHTFAFFQRNLVMEYGHAQAVADGVNLDYDIFRIRTKVSEQGATAEGGPQEVIAKRDRHTRALRWEKQDEDITYGANQLDRDVVAEDQIRTVIRCFKDQCLPTCFPGRTQIPKTLIFAKNDAHADDIVRLVREVFAKGNDFCEKITYNTGTVRVVTPEERDASGKVVREQSISYKASGVTAEDLLSSFRNSLYPRVVVTVDMIATGTDVKPLEVVMFMRAVKSRLFYEQMKGRGVRVCDDAEFQAVTPDATSKTRFVLVDCVGITDGDALDDPSPPLDRKKSATLEQLLEAAAFGSADADSLTTLASRLLRLERSLEPAEVAALDDLAGTPIRTIAAGLLAATDPETGADPIAACKPLAANPALRRRLVEVRRVQDQIIDHKTLDEVVSAGHGDATVEKARQTVAAFSAYITEHHDEIAALEVVYSQPWKANAWTVLKRLRDEISRPPRSWTIPGLWNAYAQVEAGKVKGTGGAKAVADLYQLVRHALGQKPLLEPFREQVEARYQAWLVEQAAAGVAFTDEQRRWLDAVRDHVASSLLVAREDLQESPFAGMGGLAKARRLFGEKLDGLLDDLNRSLVA
ncbi:MAG: DEAD/DEAH box helicase family protein [Planctomycetes bacterium]|nr:DEAD/DEAH box helicase family protein [Planctomycetota bacterium]